MKEELGQEAFAMTQGKDDGQLDKGDHCKKEKSCRLNMDFTIELGMSDKERIHWRLVGYWPWVLDATIDLYGRLKEEHVLEGKSRGSVFIH